MNNQFQLLEVGKVSPFPKRHINFNGGVLEASEDIFVILLYMSKVSAKEKRSLKNDAIRVRVHRKDSCVLTLIRYGQSPLIFELSFDPTLYTDNRAYKLIKNVNTAQLIGIDSYDNTINSLRFTTIPSELLSIWRECWSAAKDTPRYSNIYENWINELYAYNSVADLWNSGENVGMLGHV